MAAHMATTEGTGSPGGAHRAVTTVQHLETRRMLIRKIVSCLLKQKVLQLIFQEYYTSFVLPTKNAQFGIFIWNTSVKHFCLNMRRFTHIFF